MPIILSVQSYRAAPPEAPLSAQFDSAGGTIGRTPGNGLVLDDPGRYISRSHARVAYQGGAYCLIDTGSNPSLVNGQLLGKNKQVVLADGDQLVIGEYTLGVTVLPDGVVVDETLPFMPPQPPQPDSRMPPPARLPAPGPDAAVLAALLRGLGLPRLTPERPGEELAELAGAMLRAATSGTMEMLRARSLVKRESQIPVTILSSQSNNPLKFFPNPDAALQQMLGQSRPGYLAPEAAYANAFEDMRAHWLAMMAGMRAAMGGVLEAFEPERIEQVVSQTGVLDKLMPAAHKARLWERYLATYREVASDSDEEFQRKFGEQFARAYEAQLARLQRLD